jgi:hypothetical protein
MDKSFECKCGNEELIFEFFKNVRFLIFEILNTNFINDYEGESNLVEC